MFDWVRDLWDSLVNFLWSLLLSIFDALKDLFIWLFSMIMDLVIFIIDGLGSGLSALDITQYITALPDETRQILLLTGVSDALVILTSALLIRLLLQLIPFVRLGS